jgi:hypothetical protein
MTPLSKFPEFAALTAEINSLAGAEGKIAARIAEIDAIIRDSGDASRDLSMARVSAGLHFAETGEVRGIANDPSKLTDERMLLQEQQASIRTAIRSRQESMRALERDASRQVCADATPQHRDIAARIAHCLEQLDSLWQEEVDLFKTIASNGYDTSFSEYLQWPVGGRIGEQDAIGHYYRAVKNYGRIATQRPFGGQRAAKSTT